MRRLIFIILLAWGILICGDIKSADQGPTAKTPESASKLLFWKKEAGIRIPRAISCCTIFRDNQYWMYYTAREGIYLASSIDGLRFQEYGPVVTHGPFGSEQEFVSNPAVFQLKNGRYRMIYEGSKNRQATRKLYSAISSDGLKWTKETGVRLEDSIFFRDPKRGKNGYVTFTSVPDVIRLKDGRLRMYYTVLNESRMAISYDEGLSWEKEGKIRFDVHLETVLDPDIIRLEDGTYKLFFSTEDFYRRKQWIVSASSNDGVNFELDPGKRIEPSFGETHVVDPDVVRLPNGTYRMYYGVLFSDHDGIFSAVLQANVEEQNP